MSDEFCRSVSSSSYGETGGSGGAALATTIVNGTSGSGSGRYVSSTSNASVSSSTSSRERSSVDTSVTTADIISRYSPAGYVPTIQRQQQASGGSAHHWKHRSTSSSLNELFGGDEREVERRDLRLESSLSSSSSSSSVATGATGLWSKSKRRPSTNNTVLTTVGHARTDSAVSLAEVTTTVDDHVTHKPNDDDDKNDDTKDDDDQHNNNGNISNTGRDSNGEDIACGYGVNNNDNERDNDNDENEDDVDEDDDDRNDDNLNNCHHRFHQQHRHRSDEISPTKRNVLSPAVVAGGVSSLDLLTNLATNPHNTELLINNNAQNKVTKGEEEAEITTSDEVTRGAENVTFLQRDCVSDRDIPEDGEEESNMSSSADESSFGRTIDNVAGRPSVTHGDDPSVPSTSRRTDQPSLFSSNNLTSSPTNPSTAHQSIYRGVNEQYVSALIKKVMCSDAEQHRQTAFNSRSLLIGR